IDFWLLICTYDASGRMTLVWGALKMAEDDPKPTSGQPDDIIRHGNYIKIRVTSPGPASSKYLRVQGDGSIVADAKGAEATIFCIELAVGNSGQNYISWQDHVFIRGLDHDPYLRKNPTAVYLLLPKDDTARNVLFVDGVYPPEQPVPPVKSSTNVMVKNNHPDTWWSLRQDTDHGGVKLWSVVHVEDRATFNFEKVEPPIIT
ncbi:hypothetical protein, partial [Asticcacaulis benevestitus]|uniref:hypothetical protein n=1 Tax=Asticcacaulis benevestitus TaxID=347481 RepID=UPI001F1F09CA